MVRVPPTVLPVVIALANAALPDESPGKLTMADLTAIRTYAEAAEWWLDEHPEAETAYERVLAKLAALLPLEADAPPPTP